MSRIFITGDTHASLSWEKVNTKKFPIQKELTKDDLLIIAGDFGGVWDNGAGDKYVLDAYESRNFTTLFVDGNHENFPLLSTFPVEEFHGGKVHRIRDSVYHLMRGQVYDFGGRTFFTFGGATSHDRIWRQAGIDWWPEELPSEAELKEAERNLEACGYKVDYVISHCCPRRALSELGLIKFYTEDRLNRFFDYLTEDKGLQFKKWYFGHYHEDMEIGPWNLLFNTIEEI